MVHSFKILCKHFEIAVIFIKEMQFLLLLGALCILLSLISYWSTFFLEMCF